MKTKLKLRMLLLAIIMALGAISLSSCSNDDNLWPDDLILPEDEILGSDIYMFKYDEGEYLYLREIIGLTPSPDDDDLSSQYPGYCSKSYRTNLGDIVKILPKISVFMEDDYDIDKVIGQFGNKLSFKEKIGVVFIYNCNVRNSDEVLEITTTLSKDKRVAGCDAYTDAGFQLFDTNPLYPKQYYLHGCEAMCIANIELNTDSPYSL